MSDTKKINDDSNGSPLLTGAATVGSVIGQDYRLLQLIGQGGMGVVYKAEHRLIPGKIYAIKLLHAHAVTDSNLKRFHREAQALGKLSHQGIVRIYNFGLDSQSNLYYVMEYLEGESLSDYLKRQGPLAEPDCIRLFISVAKALGHAHRHGIIHRDLKPSNLMLCPSTDGPFGDVKIVDFGLVRLAIDNSEEKQALTATGEIFGTPYYMSPEQSVGADVNAASDVYSLGCTMFEALTGAPPFKGENAFKTLYMHQYQEPPWLKQVAASQDYSDGLEELVYKMLRKNPLERYQNMERLVQDLERLDQGLPIGFVATTGFEAAPKTVEMATQQAAGPSWRIWSLVVVFVVGLMLLAGIGANWLLHLPVAEKQKNAPVVSNPERMVVIEVDNEPAYFIHNNVLCVKPGANPNQLKALSHRDFEGIVFDGEFGEGSWSEIFSAMKSFKKTKFVRLAGMRMDRPNTDTLANLPETNDLSLCNSRLDFDSLIDHQIWAKYSQFTIEKIDPYKNCKNEQLVIVTDKLFKAIGANNHVSVFSLTRMRFSAAGLRSLLAGSRAVGINFGRCRIDAAMLKDICQSPSLKTACIYEQFYTFAQVKNAVSGAPSLKSLVLSRPVVKPELIQAVRERFSDYQDPSIHWTDGEIAAIKKLGVDLKFKDSDYVFLPALDDWHGSKEILALPFNVEGGHALELSP